jgi:release factor glutamine methyltransferase
MTVDARILFQELYKSLTLPESREEKEGILYWLLEHTLRLARPAVLAGQKVDIAEHQFDALVSRINNHEPIQYILEEAEFYGRKFRVTPDVLIPRPETEILVQHALDFLPSGVARRVLDIGTGSGCIAITLSLEAPSAKLLATDISPAALRIAGENATRICADLEFFRHDILNRSLEFGVLDMVISNPPYVMEKERAGMAPNVLHFEPSSALFVPDTNPLVYYEAIAVKSFPALGPKGVVLVEINEQLGRETMQCFERAGYPHLRIHKDLSGKDRVVCAQKAP